MRRSAKYQHRRAILYVLLAAALFGSAATVSAAGEPTSRPANSPPSLPPAMSGEGDVLNFSLLDYRGKHYELRRTDARAVVLFFTGPDCPIARQLVPKLQAISEELGPKGIVVWMVNAMPQNDPDDRRLDAMFALGGLAPRDRMGDRYIVQGMRGLVSESVLGDRETLRQ